MSDALPRGWTWATLVDVAPPETASITDGPFGSNLKTEHYTDNGPRVVRLQNIGDGNFVDEHAHISEERFQRLRRHEVSAGDVLLALLGDVLPRACVAPSSLGPAIVKADCVRARIDKRVASSAYVCCALNCEQTRKRTGSIVHGVGRPRLNLGELKQLRFPLAPRREQDRIVAAIEQHLSDVDAGVAALERARANTKRYRASVLKAACEGRLVPTEAELARREKREFEPASKLLARLSKERRMRCEQAQLAKMAGRGQTPRDDRWKTKYEEPDEPNAAELPAIPEGWCWTTLRAIADIKGGVTKGQRRRADERVRLVPYLRVANVQRGFLDLTEVKDIEATDEEIEELRLVRGDVLFNEGGDRDKLGRGWVWEEQLPLCIHQNHVFRARVPTDLVEPKFLSWYGNSFGQRYFLDEGKQTTNLASINMTKLGALPVPVPPVEEQRRIVAEVDRLLSIADEAERVVVAQLGRAARLRQSVLKAAFEGKLVPQDPNDEPAIIALERLRATASARPGNARRGRRTTEAEVLETDP